MTRYPILPRATRRAIRKLGLLREPRLPPGYSLGLTDPDVLVLIERVRGSAEGSVVARFSARGVTAEAIEEEAWKDHRERNRPA